MPVIVIEGLKETSAYIAEVSRRVTNKSKEIPMKSSTLAKRSIVNEIRSNQKWIGQYHIKTGKGLARNIIKRKTGDTSWIVTVNPTLSPLQSSTGKSIEPPQIYANYVEYGTNKFSGKYYFRDGLRKAIPSIFANTRKSARDIIKK